MELGRMDGGGASPRDATRTATPLHERIRADFEHRILSGTLGPGDRLPTEQALMNAYACSRMTASKAVSALAAAGLVVRRRRAGTVVARPRVHSMVLDIPDLPALIRARGQSYAYRALRHRSRRPEPSASAELALAGDGLLMALDGLHLADDAPFALEHRLVSLRAVPAIAEAAFDETPPGSWLLRHVPWTEAEMRIAAVRADAGAARLLRIDPDAACLAIERRTWRGADTITQVRQLFPGENYDLVARFGSSTR